MKSVQALNMLLLLTALVVVGSTLKASHLQEHVEIVEAANGKCYAPREINRHGICTCPDRKLYVAVRNECICPTYAPFWNGDFCSGCPPGMDYNLDLGICYVCPDGFTRGYKIMSCVPALEGWGKMKLEQEANERAKSQMGQEATPSV